MRYHLFLEFWLVDTSSFADWRHQRAVTCLENVRQSNIRRGKKLGFQLSHKHPPKKRVKSGIKRKNSIWSIYDAWTTMSVLCLLFFFILVSQPCRSSKHCYLYMLILPQKLVEIYSVHRLHFWLVTLGSLATYSKTLVNKFIWNVNTWQNKYNYNIRVYSETSFSKIFIFSFAPWYHSFSTYVKFSKKLIFLNVSFSENVAYLLNEWSPRQSA